MTWYRTGTAAFTNGNATVTGTGTAWIANASIGEGLIAPDGRIYEITAIASDTSLTISPAYLGSTASGQAYAVAPIRGRIAQLLSETSSLLASFATVRDGIGSGLFPNGTVGAPALRASADQDTGLFFPAANSLAVATGGTERVRIDSSGNVGFGTVSPWETVSVPFNEAIAFGSSLYSFSLQRASTGELVTTFSDTYDASTARIDFTMRRGAGAENTPLSITGAGNVGIGTTAPGVKFDVAGAARVASGATGGLLGFAENVNTSSRAWAIQNDRAAFGDLNFLTAASHGGEVNVVRLYISPAGIVRPGADSSQSFGEASFRWSEIFAGTGTINTSDEREKVWRGAMTEPEMRAAKRLLGELGMFQFTDSVEEKGEDARLHFGVRAQRAFAILEDEGLEWWRYAWCCHDQWDEITEPVMEEVTVEKTRTVAREQIDDETGETITVEVEETYEETEQRDTGEVRIVREAGDRYGIRADQLAYWLIAAQAEIQADLDARLAALESQ